MKTSEKGNLLFRKWVVQEIMALEFKLKNNTKHMSNIFAGLVTLNLHDDNLLNLKGLLSALFFFLLE